jgi:crossover junction endodeoxyribonuclease RusA
MELLPEDWHAMMGEAIWMDAIFVFSRPKAHYRTNGELKPSAPQHCTGRIGDLSKLVRAVEDALTGVVYDDDAQIVHLTSQRRYVSGNHESPCAIITITAIS